MAASENLDTYGMAWNEPEAEKRSALLEDAWADDGVYCDPTAHIVGRAALVEHIGNVRAALGAFTIERTSAYDEHDGYVRFTWDMRTAAGEAIADGIDFVQVTGEGRIALVVGFFGAIPDR